MRAHGDRDELAHLPEVLRQAPRSVRVRLHDQDKLLIQSTVQGCSIICFIFCRPDRVHHTDTSVHSTPYDQFPRGSRCQTGTCCRRSSWELRSSGGHASQVSGLTAHEISDSQLQTQLRRCNPHGPSTQPYATHLSALVSHLSRLSWQEEEQIHAQVEHKPHHHISPTPRATSPRRRCCISRRDSDCGVSVTWFRVGPRCTWGLYASSRMKKPRMPAQKDRQPSQPHYPMDGWTVLT